MKIKNVTGGTISGSDCFILSKGKYFLNTEGCIGLTLRDIDGCSTATGRLRQTWEALKFIWVSKK